MAYNSTKIILVVNSCHALSSTTLVSNKFKHPRIMKKRKKQLAFLSLAISLNSKITLKFFVFWLQIAHNNRDFQ